MKKNVILMTFLALAFSCTKEPAQKPIDIGFYSKQVYQINEVVNKLMEETNVKVMHDMADGVEETRAIGCDAVGEECNAYYGFLSKVVTLTNDGELSEADHAELVKMRSQLNSELKKSEIKLRTQWKNYINTDKK